MLDATEGRRADPAAPLDPTRLAATRCEELGDAYFDGIPDVFRRPNDRLYEWLRRADCRRAACGASCLRRYVWCDLWHAELPRLRRVEPACRSWTSTSAGDDATAAAAARWAGWRPSWKCCR